MLFNASIDCKRKRHRGAIKIALSFTYLAEVQNNSAEEFV